MKAGIIFLLTFAAAATAAAQTPAEVPPIAFNALAQAQGPALDLRIDDAVARALERNLDIAVERLNPQTFDFSLAALYATYRPALTSQVGYRDQTTFSRSQTAGGDVLVTETTTANAGIAQNLQWGGGSYSVAFGNTRVAQTDLFATRNPAVNTNLNAVFVQPLLRGFKTDTIRTQLRVTAINQDISEIQVETTVNNTLANVRNAYWDLVYAQEAVRVAQSSLELAEKLIADNQARVEIGTMAPIDVVQSEAEAATRRQTLTLAEATWQTAELALKRLIVSGTEDPLWSARINPTDRPSFAPEAIDLQGAIRNAVASRTDIAEAKKTLESNDLTLKNLVNQTLPALDLQATYGLAGVGGTVIERGGLGGAVTNVIPGGYADALRTLGNVDAPTWALQMNLSYPIGTSAADAGVARARLQIRQTQAQLKALELQVATEVTTTGLNVQSNLKRVEAATAARELAQKRLEAENSKFEVGMSTNFLVVQAQRDLADAQITALRAVLDYEKSKVDFERVQRTALSRAGISVISGAQASGGTTNAAAAAGGTGAAGAARQQ
ncbi:MAG TPA: TolC family protein [Vicinamibacterales bacterium]|jgi:outer membrane protein TolC|nr:TolC family protein [Vicinamibacterales bacterium]